MEQGIERVRARWATMRERRGVRLLVRYGRTVLVVAIVAFLVYQLSRIGWVEFFGSLPTSPLFYLLFLGLYFALPLSETVIYRSIWPLRFGQALAGMLRKRVYNKDVLGYSGEVFLALWAGRLTGRPRRRIAAEIKDNFVLSVAAITLWTVGLLAVLLLTGQLAVLSETTRGHERLLVYVVIPVVVAALVAVGIRFRRSIFHLPTRDLVRIGAIHAVRVVGVSAMQVVQWMVVMPEVSLQTWFSFLAVLLLISRIPLLPSRDLIFVGAGIELSRFLDVPPAPIAGMLLVQSVLDKLLNLVLFTLLSRADRGAAPLDAPADATQEVV